LSNEIKTLLRSLTPVVPAEQVGIVNKLERLTRDQRRIVQTEREKLQEKEAEIAALKRENLALRQEIGRGATLLQQATARIDRQRFEVSNMAAMAVRRGSLDDIAREAKRLHQHWAPKIAAAKPSQLADLYRQYHKSITGQLTDYVNFQILALRYVVDSLGSIEFDPTKEYPRLDMAFAPEKSLVRFCQRGQQQ